ncbi:MAG: ATP-grasp domain-containing protein [Synergistaceae bacterium]|jgi:carbamoyl-phosphate synthase large subunit|nr:ATP-grasp domain-containing protein [Synergistaceae bacterium]
MNILILSCGIRVKIVEYFKKALLGDGKVIAADCSKLAPALYAADGYYLVPPVKDDGYVDIILDICEKENIKGLFSLIDPELSILARNAGRFAAKGATVIGSNYEICERCLDKWEMYRWLTAHGYSCAKTYRNQKSFDKALKAGEISFPVIMKPVRGSASAAVEKVSGHARLEALFSDNGNDFIVQQFMDGLDLDADAYVDMQSGEVVSIFMKQKLLMRAGEADKAVSFYDEELFGILKKFIEESGFRGVIDIDVFKVGGSFYISEVNPRFGGVYPHAYECGLDFPAFIVKNLSGFANRQPFPSYPAGVVMMKYPEIMTIK